MIRINLLPFRSARKKENIRRQLSIFVLSLILTVVAIFGVNLLLDSQIGDLNSRGGKVGMISAKGTISIVDAHVPLKPMFGYPTSLRSLTQGRGSFSMHFSHYDRSAQ